MDLIVRGRRIGKDDLRLIRTLIASEGHRGRTYLSRELCRIWNWLAPGGALKDAACRALLGRLEDEGLIQLPPRQRGVIRGRPQRRGRRQMSLDLTLDPPACAVFPRSVRWELAHAGRSALLYKDLLASHHYLGYHPEVGRALRYLAYADGRPIAALGWASAAWKVGARDRFIGWSRPQRERNLHLVAANTRFLILPRVPHLASHLLGACARRLASDWREIHGYAPVLLETFVDTTRFAGTCYKAANWIHAGLTEGRGKYDRLKRRAQPVKAVFLYPLRRDFREILAHD